MSGSAFLAAPGTEAYTRPVPEGAINITGSHMIYQLETIEAVWDRLKRDPYWSGDVWDKEKMRVELLMG